MVERNDIASELKDNRIKNTTKTVLANIVNVIIATLGPFCIRTLMIYYLGDKYAGINSLFVSFISILNMSELGFSNVIVFFLYEPLAKGDTATVGRYLNALKKIYRIIGIFLVTVGIFITPFLPHFVKDAIPSDINVYRIFIIYLFAISIQYFISPETLIIANAIQKGYISSVVTIVGNFFVYLLQAVAIIEFHNFEFYYISIFIECTLVALERIYIRRNHFSEFKVKGDLTKKEWSDIGKRVVALMGHLMNTIVLPSIDKIVITALMGLVVVTKYENYMYIVTATSMFLITIMQSLTASIGNAIATEGVEANYTRFRATLWFNGVVGAWMTTGMLCLYQPFMKEWMGDRLFPISTVFLFLIYFFSTEIRKAAITFKDANGMWWEDRYRPYISALINLAMDIVFVYKMGVNGALIASILCQSIIDIPWEGKVLYEVYFKKNVWFYLKEIAFWFSYTFIVAAGIYIFEKALVIYNNIWTILLGGIIITFVYIVITLVTFRKSEELKVWKDSIGILLKS